MRITKPHLGSTFNKVLHPVLFNQGVKNGFSIHRSAHIPLAQEQHPHLCILQVLKRQQTHQNRSCKHAPLSSENQELQSAMNTETITQNPKDYRSFLNKRSHAEHRRHATAANIKLRHALLSPTGWTFPCNFFDALKSTPRT